MKKTFLALILLLGIFLPGFSSAQEGLLVGDTHEIVKARVIRVLFTEERLIPTTDIIEDYQTLEIEVLEGRLKGEVMNIENDYFSLDEGEVIYLKDIKRYDTGEHVYSVHDKYRLPAVMFFVVLFILCIFIFGGLQGVRGLASLIGSVLLIVFVLMPGILNGYSPVLVTILVSSLIIILGSYITHGFNRTTSSAVIGMIITVLLTGVLAWLAVHFSDLSGFDSEEAVYLNWNTNGSIDFIGLLFGGIMIGLLGVLYDVAIGQAISAEELYHAGIHDRKLVFKRLVRIGREHIGALVNTLAIAYVGASLPLLLLFYGNTNFSFFEILNREIFAAEIIRTMVGSIGLVIAVPITSMVAVWMLVKGKEE